MEVPVEKKSAAENNDTAYAGGKFDHDSTKQVVCME